MLCSFTLCTMLIQNSRRDLSEWLEPLPKSQTDLRVWILASSDTGESAGWQTKQCEKRNIKKIRLFVTLICICSASGGLRRASWQCRARVWPSTGLPPPPTPAAQHPIQRNTRPFSSMRNGKQQWSNKLFLHSWANIIWNITSCQCCGSGMFIPDPYFSIPLFLSSLIFYPSRIQGSKWHRISDHESATLYAAHILLHNWSILLS